MPKIRVAIADDHKIFRSGIISSLSYYEDIEITLETSNGKELLENLTSKNIDVILLDVKMPNMDGYETLSILRGNNDDVKVIVLTMHEEDSFIYKFMDSRANSYLVKNSDPAEVYLAIKECHEKGYYMNKRINDVLASKFIEKKHINYRDGLDLAFDSRELKVLKLLAEQKTSLQISKELFIGVRTVDSIRAELLRKTQSKNTAGLVIFCYKNNLIK